MSHITTHKTEIRDLDALKSACSECGAVFVEGQTTYQWFGVSVGITHCRGHHQGSAWEVFPRDPRAGRPIRNRSRPEANGHWTLAYDFWDLDRAAAEVRRRLSTPPPVVCGPQDHRRSPEEGLHRPATAAKDGSVKLVLLATGGAL